MRFQATLLLGVVFLIAAESPKDDPAKKDQEKLQGTWKAVEIERNGKKAPPEAIDAIKAQFKDDKFSMKRPGQEFKEIGTFKLDPATKGFELKLTAGYLTGSTSLGIYAFDGDNLKLCLAKSGSPKPTEFTTKEGTENVVFVWKREK